VPQSTTGKEDHVHRSASSFSDDVTDQEQYLCKARLGVLPPFDITGEKLIRIKTEFRAPSRPNNGARKGKRETKNAA